MVLVLSRQDSHQLHSLFERKGDLYSQIKREIIEYSGPEHARIFAQPEYNQDVIRWNSEGDKSLSWQELDENQQQKLLAATRSILSDIELAVQSHPRSVLAQFFPYCRQFPSLNYLYAVDGRPVITAWGYADENGTFDPLVNVPSKVSPSRFIDYLYFPWLTALIALIIGLIVSIFWVNRDFNGKSCTAIYPPLSQVQEALKAQKENQQLTNKRNGLLDQWNILKKQCEIPPAKPLIPVDPPKIEPLQSPPVPPELPPVQDEPQLPKMDLPQKKDMPKPPTPKPEKKVDLPKESWNKKDTSMLNGCWHLTTHLELYQHGLFVNSHQPVTNWSLCFSPNAAGRQVLTRADGGTCQGPLHAGFQGNQLVLNQPADCTGDFHLIAGKNVCTRLDDHQARCTYIDEEGHQSTGIFKR